MVGVGLDEPSAQPVAPLVDRGAEVPALLADERAQVRDELGLAEQGAHPVMALGQQVVAEVGQEVPVAGQDRDGLRQGFHEIVRGVRHRAAEVAHDRAGGAEGVRHRVDAGEDECRPFGRHLPGAQDPAPPASEGHEQRATPVFPRRVEMQRPAAVGLQGRAQRRGGGVMHRLEIDEKAAPQRADLAGRERQAVPPFELRANLLALAVVHEPIEADRDHDVVADHAAGAQDRGQGRRPAGHACAGPLAPERAGVDRLLNAKRPVGERHAVTAERLLHVHAAPAHRAGVRRVVDGDQQVPQPVHLSLTGVAEGGGLSSHGRERREGERTGFFRS